MEKKPSNIIPNHPTTLPKPFQDGSKFDPEGFLEFILAHPFSKLYFEHPKNVQEAPKSADKAQLSSNLAPTWSQLGSIRGSKIETKNIQNRCWKTSPILLRMPCAAMKNVMLANAKRGGQHAKQTLETSQVGSKLASCWLQVGSKLAQVGSKLAPSWPMLVQVGPSWSK